MSGPLKFAVLVDTKDVVPSMGKVDKAMESSASTAEKSGARIDSAFSGAAEGADHVASKGSQAAGALSGLGGLAAMSGGKVGALGTAMTVAGVATQGLADAGDLLNVVTESTIVKNALAKVAWVTDAVVKGASTVATGALTVATTALGIAVAVATSPVTLLALGLAALVVAVILTVKHFDTIEATAKRVFDSVETKAKAPIDWIRAHWPLLLGILTGPFGLAVVAIRGHVDSILDKVKAVPGKIRALGSDMADAGEHLADKLVSGITKIGGKAGDIAKGIVNDVIDLLNSALPHSLNTHIPGIGTVSLIPNIPHLANGGITTGPTLALIGDNPGGREAVIPLDKYGIGSGSSGGGDVHIHLNGTFIGSTKAEIGRWLSEAGTAYAATGGRVRAA